MKIFYQAIIISFIFSIAKTSSAAEGITLSLNPGIGLKYSSTEAFSDISEPCLTEQLPKLDWDLINITAAKSCFPTESFSADLVNYSSYEFFSFKVNDNVSAFKKQQDVCNCINNSIIGNKTSNPKDILNSEEYALAHLENTMKGFSEKSHSFHNLMILHAQSFGQDASKKYGLDQPVNINDYFRKFVNDVIQKNLKNNLKITADKEKDFTKQVNEIMAKTHEEVKKTSVLDLLGKSEAPGESCYPMKQYLLVNSFPKQNEFWASFNNDFSEKDWDISDLRSRYLTVKNETEKELIQGKIEFLEKNPFVKLALNSKDRNAAKRVYDVMKKHMGGLSKRCRSKGECQEKFIEKSLPSYQNEISSLFQEPEMMKLIRKERKSETEKQITDLLNNSQEKLNINSLTTWAKKTSSLGVDLEWCGRHMVDKMPQLISSQILIPRFVKFFDYNEAIDSSMITLDEDKSEPDLNMIACQKFVPEYCAAVGRGDNSILSQGSNLSEVVGNRQRLEDLYESIHRDMNPNPEDNFGYQELSGDACLLDFRKYNGLTVNFEGFKERFCANKTNQAVCTDKDLLYESFTKLASDNRGSDKNSNKPYFDHYKNKVNIATLTEEEIQTFNRDGSSSGSLVGLSKSSTSASVQKDSQAISFIDEFTSTESIMDQGTANTSSLSEGYQSTNYMSSVPNSVRESKEERDEEIKTIKEAIDYNKERLSRTNTTPAFRSEIEERVRSLEMLLAEKEKSSQQYQDLISKLITDQSQGPGAVAAAEATNASKNQNTKEEGKKVASSSTVRSSSPNLKNIENNEDSSRAPASVADNFSTSGGVRGGGGSIGAGSLLDSSGASRGRGAINTALLSKYGITVQESDDNVQVARDTDKNDLSQLLVNASKSDIGIEVSKSEYDRFKKNDINALNKLYEDRLEDLDTQVVKLLIHADGVDESLEFYAIKEDGKVVFQPVRKTRLSDLQNALAN